MALFRRRKNEPESASGHPWDSGTDEKSERGAASFTGRSGPPVFPDPGTTVFDDVPVWFRRISEIPGLQGVRPDQPVSLQPEHAERPWVYFGSDPWTGEVKFRQLQWPGSIGSERWPPSEFGHGWSPAQRAAFGGEDLDPTASVTEIVENLWPKLNLPGIGIDYHFLLQKTVERLWKKRDTDDSARKALIMIAEIDRSLADAHPESLTLTGSNGKEFINSSSLDRLSSVYEQLGDLEAAFEVTVFAERFDQLESRRERLAKKLGRVGINEEQE